MFKNLPAMQETWVQSLGWEHPLEKGKYSGLENSMDYTVHGVAKNPMQPSKFHSLKTYQLIFKRLTMIYHDCSSWVKLGYVS